MLSNPPSFALPSSISSLPRKTFSKLAGCSKISLSMKWACPPFSASCNVHSISVTAFFTAFGGTPPEAVAFNSVITNPSLVKTAISPSSKKTIFFECARIAAASEAANVPKSFMETTRGAENRATITLSGSSLENTAMP